MPTITVGAGLVVYAAALFAVGWLARKRRFGGRGAVLLTALSIGVYCTSWTFYGAVGTAVRTGWDYLPIYLGPILAFTIGLPLIERAVALGKGHGATSLPDMLSRRFGRSGRLAALVTVTLVVVSIPYIALQLIAVSSTFAHLTGAGSTRPPLLILTVALVLAGFGLVFGTRNRDVTHANPGLVSAMAFDSGFKLLAFAAVAIIGAGLAGGQGSFVLPGLGESFQADRFVLLTLLSGFMMLCLPRQFHMTVVEPEGQRVVRKAAPLAVLYFALFALLVPPLVGAGNALQAEAEPDLLVLAVPQALGLDVLTLIAFTGGFAAAAGMVIVAGVALSTMVASDLVLPALSRKEGTEAFGYALTIRRLSLCVLICLAALFALIVPGGALLAELGVVAFAGAGQLAPLLVATLFVTRIDERAAFLALIAGMAGWIGFVLAPAFFAGSLIDVSRIAAAIFPFLSDDFTRGTVLSLLMNTGVMVAVAAISPAALSTKEEAAHFAAMGAARQVSGQVRLRDLEALLTRIIGEEDTQQLLRLHGPAAEGFADGTLVAAAEAKLSRVLGNASAHILLNRLLVPGRVDAGEVLVLMGEASRELRFSQELLSATLDNLAEGVSVIDKDARLVAWNKAYTDLFRYPPQLLAVGTHVAELFRHNRPDLTEAEIAKRVAGLQDGKVHNSETILRDGRILRLQGRPVPGGGYVTSFFDVTEYREAEAALAESERATRFYTDNIPFPIAFSDPGETIRFHNKAYARMASAEEQDLTGRSLRQVLGERYALREPSVAGVLRGETQRFVLGPAEIGGKTTWQVTYVPQTTEGGTVLGFFGFYQDISKRRAAQAALEEANRTLEARVVSRTAQLQSANEEADKARKEAETANRSKTRFLAAASHDVLQPLNAARLFASTLEDSLPEETDDQAMARKIGAAIVSADTLLRSLLNLSKLEAGGVDPKKKALALGPFLAGIADEFAPSAAVKDLRLKAVATSLAAYTDPGLLRSALQNLVSNAVRYTDEGGILIGVRPRGMEVVLEVVDTGRGLSSEEIPLIFDEFSRLQRDRDVEGAGLGLATVRRVAQLLEHEIEVSSVPGRGTIFRVYLPKVLMEEERRPASRGAQPDMAGQRVLCVDNDSAVLEALRSRFERWGAKTDAHSSVAAVRTAFTNGAPSPDLLILDYQLDGDETGLDVLDFFRKERGADCPAIVVTASRSPETDAAIAQRGVPILPKPVEPASLRALSVSLLNGRKA
jgi:PAS domain S-box-containing protein